MNRKKLVLALLMCLGGLQHTAQAVTVGDFFVAIGSAFGLGLSSLFYDYEPPVSARDGKEQSPDEGQGYDMRLPSKIIGAGTIIMTADYVAYRNRKFLGNCFSSVKQEKTGKSPKKKRKMVKPLYCLEQIDV